MARAKSTTKTVTKLKYPDMFNVIFLNDDFTPMDFVISLLVEVFNKDLSQAQAITMAIHEDGKAVAGTFPHEIAEQKTSEAQIISRHNGHPLKITMEPVK